MKMVNTYIANGFLEIFAQWEKLVWQKRIRNREITVPPVFIIGFWRSGTTLIHNLMCQDPEAAYTTTFQTVFPHVVLTQSWWLKPLVNLLLPENRPYDNVSMDMDFPQEEDFGLMNLQSSSMYKFFLFPGDFDQIVNDELLTGSLPSEKINRWKEAYHDMIAKALYNTKGSRYIGKNPCHLARIELLLGMFPDAKFIFIHRHPYKVNESLYHFLLSVFPGTQLENVPPTFTMEKVVGLYKSSLEAYFRGRHKIPEKNLAEIGLDGFLDDIKGNLKTLYQKFGFTNFNRAEPWIDQYLQEHPGPCHRSLPPTEETICLVNKHANHIMARLGYPSDPELAKHNV